MITDAPSEQHIITPCDAAFFERVESDLQDIVKYQSIKNNLRMISKGLKPIFWLNKCIDRYYPRVRILLFGGCLVVLCCLSVLLVTAEKPTSFLIILWLAYMVFCVVFWRVKDMRNIRRVPKHRIDTWAANKKSQQILKKARLTLPYTAHYAFVGDTVTYHRMRDDQRDLVWSKQLESYAIVHDHVALFYKTNKAIAPRTVMMYEDKAPMLAALQRINIDYLTYDASLFDELITQEKKHYGVM